MKALKACMFSTLVILAGAARAGGTVGDLPGIQAVLQAKIEARVVKSIRQDIQRQVEAACNISQRPTPGSQVAGHNIKTDRDS